MKSLQFFLHSLTCWLHCLLPISCININNCSNQIFFFCPAWCHHSLWFEMEKLKSTVKRASCILDQQFSCVLSALILSCFIALHFFEGLSVGIRSPNYFAYNNNNSSSNVLKFLCFYFGHQNQFSWKLKLKLCLVSFRMTVALTDHIFSSSIAHCILVQWTCCRCHGNR